jgi:putative transposase
VGRRLDHYYWLTALLAARGVQATTSGRLAEAGISAWVGSVGDSLDNALAETIKGMYKTELIKPRRPWRTVEQVEHATAEWVVRFNHRRVYEYCGDIPPAELEAAYYREHGRTFPTSAPTPVLIEILIPR